MSRTHVRAFRDHGWWGLELTVNGKFTIPKPVDSAKLAISSPMRSIFLMLKTADSI